MTNARESAPVDNAVCLNARTDFLMIGLPGVMKLLRQPFTLAAAERPSLSHVRTSRCFLDIAHAQLREACPPPVHIQPEFAAAQAFARLLFFGDAIGAEPRDVSRLRPLHHDHPVGIANDDVARMNDR